MSTVDWSKVTSFERAAKNVRGDIFGDWYRDPWGWPEVEWVVRESPRLLFERLNDQGIKRSLPINVPKENFVIRPAVQLDILDRLAYQALVDSLSAQLIGDLPLFVYGWRLWIGNPKKGFFARNSDQWTRYRHRLRNLAERFHCGLTTDIASFFASVSIKRLHEEISQRISRNAVMDRLVDFLHESQNVKSRAGLPQRCLASSALAQFYLEPLDDLLAGHASDRAPRSRHHGVRVCRWMDDVWIFSNHRRTLRAIQMELQQCLADLGLLLNAAKTTVYEGLELRRVVNEYEHSAADAGLGSLPQDPKPLEQLVDQILDEPETAPRTNISFATNRMRKHKRFYRLKDFVKYCPQLPHGADHLGRLFRDSEAWRHLADWYVGQAKDLMNDLEWVAFQLGTMFPEASKPSNVFDFFANQLSAGQFPVLMVPLAAQRLTSWDRKEARGIIQSTFRIGRYEENPFAIRALVYSGLSAGIQRSTLRSILKQLPETSAQLSFLEDRNFQQLRTVKDFR